MFGALFHCFPNHLLAFFIELDRCHDPAFFQMQIKQKSQPENMENINVKSHGNACVQLINAKNVTDSFKSQKRSDTDDESRNQFVFEFVCGHFFDFLRASSEALNNDSKVP